MSQEDVDLTRVAVDAFDRRDVDSFLALNDPDVEFAPVEASVEGGQPFRGHDGVRRWWAETFEVFPDFEIDLVGIRDLGEQLLVNARLRGRGANSGATIDRAVWSIITWHEGRVVSWFSFESSDEALEAAGLRE